MAVSLYSTNWIVDGVAQAYGNVTCSRKLASQANFCHQPRMSSLTAGLVHGDLVQSRQRLGSNQSVCVGRLWGGGNVGDLQLRSQNKNFRPSNQGSAKLVVCSCLVSTMAPNAVQLAASMFTFSQAFVVPFYTAMILAPQWNWTKKLAESNLPFVVLGVLYVYLLSISWTSETFGLLFASKHYLPELPGITRMFSSTITVASAWIHLLTCDLFCGRYVFLDGLQHNVETRHSLVLCLMMCPIGIFSHLVTKAISLFLRRAIKDEAFHGENSNL